MSRVCEWCGRPLPEGSPDDKLTCDDAHRARRYRWLRNIPRADGSHEQPPSDSPLLQWSADGLAAREARANGAGGHRSTSGLQLPYQKALRVVTDELAMFVEPRRVEAALRKALPDRQRERLEARG